VEARSVEANDRQGAPVTREEWAALARTFPTLRNAPGVREGEEPNPLDLDAWAAHPDGYAGTGAQNAAAFMLNIFDSRRPWAVGPFNMRYAWGSWDLLHQRAWQAWAMEPRFA
jgi:hypothetical protein